MVKKTSLDIAFEVISRRKRPVKFKDILEEIKKVKQLSDEDILKIIGYLHSDLTLDPRFVNTGDNCWTLAERVKFDDIKKIDIEEDEEAEEAPSDEDEDESSEEFGDSEYESLDIDRAKVSDDEDQEV